MRLLRDRTDAGRLLAEVLRNRSREANMLVLALPRGGVPVAFEVAHSLEAPLDVFLVRKLGVPGHEELAMGAVSMGGTLVFNHEVIDAYTIDRSTIDRVVARESAEIGRRESVYRHGKLPLQVKDKTILLIDDGLATGSTMLAAVRALRVLQPLKLMAAVPVAPKSTCDLIRPELDELICLSSPEPFYGVGQWYEDFSQTTDEEVIKLLNQAEKWSGIRKNHQVERSLG